MTDTKQAATISAEGEVGQGILGFLDQALGRECFDSVLATVRLPRGDSFAHVLIVDGLGSLDVHPLSPIMRINGARALSDLTRQHKGKKIAALLRPCEARAAVELSKLGQVDLEDVILVTLDCPGAVPLVEWAKDPQRVEELFAKMTAGESIEEVRPICRMCDRFSTTGAEDLHIGTLGMGERLLLIPGSAKGERVLETLGLSIDQDASEWQAGIQSLAEEKRSARAQAEAQMAEGLGLDKLLDMFGACINCHNCMRVCPVCSCRQCFFDSDQDRFPFEEYLARAEMSGGMRLPPDTLLFHIGRMLHMSLSCVSCGACEDACPSSIPVAQIFSLVGDRNQKEFHYLAGEDRDEPLPLRRYAQDEFEEVEQSHSHAAGSEETRSD